MILHQDSGIKGLTSAADIWFVAALGMAVGARMYTLAIFVSLLMLLALIGLSPLSNFLSRFGNKRHEIWKNGKKD